MTNYEIRIPWPRTWRPPHGFARALVIGVIAAAVAVIGITTWNSYQAVTGIHQLQATNASKLQLQISDAQIQIASLNGQISTLEQQGSADSTSIGTLVVDVQQLASALQADIDQLKALGQKPAAAQPHVSTSATATTTPIPTPAPVARAAPTAPAPSTTPTTSCAVQALGSCLIPSPTTPRAVATGPGFGCAQAIAYLQANSAPGFTFGCAPHSALGHYGYTCTNVPGICAESKHIQIACPAPFVYQNEASNSFVITGAKGGRIDPYGQYDARYPCNSYA